MKVSFANATQTKAAVQFLIFSLQVFKYDSFLLFLRIRFRISGPLHVKVSVPF